MGSYWALEVWVSQCQLCPGSHKLVGAYCLLEHATPMLQLSACRRCPPSHRHVCCKCLHSGTTRTQSLTNLIYWSHLAAPRWASL
jgi:hypothetical protein